MAIKSVIPSPPTPPMPGKSRDIIYGIWAWLSGFAFLATIGWSAIPGQDIPSWLIVTSIVLNGFGSLTGFLAKDNVRSPN